MYSSKFRPLIITTVFFTLPCLWLASCDNLFNPNTPLELSGTTMGSIYTIKLIESGMRVEPLIIKRAVDDLLEDINASISTWQPDSELSGINRAPDGVWLPVSEELYHLMTTALRISEQTHGAFDVSAGALVNLWGFGPSGKPVSIPEADAIRSVLAETGFKKIHLDSASRSIKKDNANIYIDLSGIGQGYAVDRIAELLEQRFTVHNYMVDLSGDIRTKGVNPEGEPWRIGIEKPSGNPGLVERIISLQNSGMSTSGDYRNYYEENGVRYSHIIDPSTGQPVRHNLVSVTVLHEECMIADAWDTAIMVLGPERGMELANQLGLAAFFIVKQDSGFVEMMSDRFRDHIRNTQ